MADFEPPSFSLGLDFDLFDSEPQLTFVSQNREPSSSNQLSIPSATIEDEYDNFETLIVDDSEPEYPDPDPNPKRLRRGASSALHSTASVVDEDMCTGALTSQPGKRKQIESSLTLDKSYPPAHCYFFHEDLRIQELVRNRLPNFSPLSDVSNSVLEQQPSTSKIDYMGQFSCAENSSSRKISRKSKSDDMSQGWVNPKLCVDKVTAKRAVKRTGHNARQTAGHWLTGSDGKKVYVGKSGQELTGRIAYRQYKKESGSGFKKSKRNSFSKKKKKK